MKWIVPATLALLLACAGCNRNAPTQGTTPAQTAQSTNPPQSTAPPNNPASPNTPAPSNTAAPPNNSSSALQQPPPTYPPNPTAPLASPATPPPGAPAPSGQAPPPQPAALTIPAGEHVTVRTIDSVDSKTNTAGQVFRATLATPLVSHRQVVIPAGTPVSLLLAQAKSAGRIQGRSELEVRLSHISYRGHSYRVASSIYQQQGKGRGQQTAARTGIGAVAGAIIGGIAGGGKGAAIGSAAGGGAGFGANVFTHGQQVKIPSETLLTFRLERPLTVQP